MAPSSQPRRAELLGVLALAADAGMGHPSDLALRAAALTVALGRKLQVPTRTLADAYHLALLRFSGCTADAHLAADAFGDEVEARGWLATADFGKPLDVLGTVVRHLGEGERAWTRARMIAHAFSRMSSLYDTALAHCEVAQRLGGRLGFPPELLANLLQVFERWDGKGIPNGLRGEAIALPVRLATLAHDVALLHAVGGREAALEVARKRSGGAHEPRLVAALVEAADELLAVLETPSAWDAVLQAEPLPWGRYDADALDAALSALGDFADLRSRFTLGHSGSVAALAAEAGRQLGLPEEELVTLRRAALVHDLGRAAVSASIWDKAGPLSDGEWEKVRLHSYVTGRCLVRAEALKEIAELAQSHHERHDGTGYHRGLAGQHQSVCCQLLAASDAYCAMTEARPHRPALSPAEARAELLRDVERGRHSQQAAHAVLAAAGHRTPKVERPAGLSERELEVLALLCRGLSNKEMAAKLGLSPKTVGHHVQHIYDKLDVSTRAAATLYAAEHGLIGR